MVSGPGTCSAGILASFRQPAPWEALVPDDFLPRMTRLHDFSITRAPGRVCDAGVPCASLLAAPRGALRVWLPASPSSEHSARPLGGPWPGLPPGLSLGGRGTQAGPLVSCWSWGTGDCLFPLGWPCQVPPCDHDQTDRPRPTLSQPVGGTFQAPDPITFELGMFFAGQCLAGGGRSVGPEEGVPQGAGCGPLAKSLSLHWGLREDAVADK